MSCKKISRKSKKSITIAVALFIVLINFTLYSSRLLCFSVYLTLIVFVFLNGSGQHDSIFCKSNHRHIFSAQVLFDKFSLICIVCLEAFSRCCSSIFCSSSEFFSHIPYRSTLIGQTIIWPSPAVRGLLKTWLRTYPMEFCWQKSSR